MRYQQDHNKQHPQSGLIWKSQITSDEADRNATPKSGCPNLGYITIRLL